MAVRALDFAYRQPPLSLSTGRGKAKQISMLLMYGSMARSRQNSMSKHEVTRLLRFIFEWLYPEGFSEGGAVRPESFGGRFGDDGYRRAGAGLRFCEDASLNEGDSE